MSIKHLIKAAVMFGLVAGPWAASAQAPNFNRDRIKPKAAKPTNKRLKALPKAKTGKSIIQSKYGKKGARSSQGKARKISLKSINAAAKKGARGKGSKARSYKKKDRVPTANRVGSSQAKITVDEYVAELNKLSKRLAAAGIDTTKDGTVTVGQVKMDTKALQAAVKAAKNYKKISAVEVPFKSSFKNKAKAKARGGKKRMGSRLLPSTKYSVKKPTSKAGARGSKKKRFDSDSKPSTKMYKSWSMGSKNTAKVELIGHAQVIAEAKRIQVNAKAEAKAYLFGEDKSIVKIYGDLDADDTDSKGLLKGKAGISILGSSVTEESWDEENYYEFDGSLWSMSEEFGYAVYLAIGPIPVTIEVGAAFETGVDFRFIISPTKIESELVPYVAADAYARFAIDIVVASAGISGQFTLLDAEVGINGKVELDQDEKGLYVAYGYGVNVALEALSGTISAFLKVKWCIWGCTSTYKLDILKFSGLRKSWELLKKSHKQYLTGKNEKAGKKEEVSRFCPSQGMKAIGQTACRIGGKRPPLKKAGEVYGAAGRDSSYSGCFLYKKKKSNRVSVYCLKSMTVLGKKVTSKVQCLTSKKFTPDLTSGGAGSPTKYAYCAVASVTIGEPPSSTSSKDKKDYQAAVTNRVNTHYCNSGKPQVVQPGKNNASKAPKLLFKQNRKNCPYWYDTKNIGIFTLADTKTTWVKK